MRTTPLLAAALVGALVVGVLTTTPQTASAAPAAEQSIGPTLIDNTDTAAWTYVGTWGSASHQSWTAGEHGDTETWSNETGARAQLQFYGTSVTLRGPKGPNGGRFRVTIDCTYVIDGDSYAGSKTMRQQLVVADTLPRGWHTVVVEVLGTRSSGSTDAYVMLDVAEVKDEPSRGEFDGAYEGRTGDVPTVTGAMELRRPGCGTTSSLVGALKNRVVNGTFTVPGTPSVSGRVNAHSAVANGSVPGGPVTIGGTAIEAATIPLLSTSVTMRIDLPDRPRTLTLSLAADERFGEPVQVGVAGDDGMFLPLLLRAGGAATVRHVPGEAITLTPGEPVEIMVDLRDHLGAGTADHLDLWAQSSATAELDLLAGRTADVSADRLAGQLWGTGVFSREPSRLAAPMEAFRHGPVVLSRVLADADRAAWTGDQNTPDSANAMPVPLLYGESAAGQPLRVNGAALTPDSIGIRLPLASPGSATSTVHLRFDTGQRCRAFTASVGLDDASPSGAFATLGVYGDGQPVALHHNGVWAGGPIGDSSALTNSRDRQAFANQLQLAKELAISSMPRSAEANAPALKAIVADEVADYAATVSDNSAALMTYPIASPLRLGAGSTATEGAPDTFHGTGDQIQGVRSIDARALFPLSADLLTAKMRDSLRWAATGKVIQVGRMAAPLARTVDLVVSGTPGAILDLESAGLDCVTIDDAPDGTPAPSVVMPRWSQIGVAPMFMPAARGAGGQALDTLTASPLWWDLMCPQGPSTSGLAYEAKRTIQKTYHYSRTEFGSTYRTTVQTVEVATASKPACAFPADQLTENYSDPQLISAAVDLPEDAVLESTVVTDPVKQQYDEIGEGWKDRFLHWAARVWAETRDDAVTWAIWLIMAPLDPVGAVIFNPITLHALPVDVQLAAGLAFVAVQPALSAGLTRVLSGTAPPGAVATERLLFTSSAQAEAEVAAGRAALIDLGGSAGRLLVPLKGAAADVAVSRLASPLIEVDSVTSRLPVTDGRVAWFEDVATVTGEDARVLCTRDVEMKPCLASGGLTTATASHAGVELTDLVPGPAHATVPDFWKRYPTAQTRAVSADLPEAAAALAATTELQVTKMDPARIFVAETGRFKLPTGTRYRPAVSTDDLPLYRLDNRPPSEVFESGFDIRSGAKASYLGEDFDWLNIYLHAEPGENLGAQDPFVSLSYDPDLLGTPFSGTDTLAFHWRYKVVRPFGRGGGFQVKASLSPTSPPASAALNKLAAEPMVTSEAEVVVPGGVQSKWIYCADLMQYNPATGRMESVMRVFNDRFDSAAAYGRTVGKLDPLPSEKAGADVRVHKQSPWAEFDWYLPDLHGDQSFEIAEPSAKNYADLAASGGGALVYTRAGAAWQVVPADWNLTEALLSRDFESGTWAGHPDVPVWIPRATARIEREGEGFLPSLCRRDTEMLCAPSRLPQYTDPRWTGVFGTSRYPRGFWERYPTLTTATALGGTPQAADAVAATARMSAAGIDPTLAFLATQAGDRFPVAFATDTLPVYRFASRGPDEIFNTGFQVRAAAVTAFQSGDARYLDLLKHASPDVHPLEDALYVSTTRDPDLLGARYVGNDQLASHWRYKIARPQGGGVEVRASFAQAGLPPEVRKLADDALILAESEVSVPGGISPKFIERADYMQYNPATRRFEVAYSVPNRVTFDPAEIYPGGARPGISALERTGSSVADSPFHSWARFDWMPPRGMMALDVPQPTAAFAQAVTKGDVLVFTKSERVWRAYPSGAGLSASALRNAGFAAGTYAGHPELVFWVPRPGYIPVSTVSAPGFAALPVKRSQAEDPVTGDVALGLGDRRLVDTGKDYAVTGSGSGVHDLALGTASDPGGRWRFEKVEGSVYRLLNPDRGTALQLTNEWYGDSSSGVRVVVGSPIGWNSAQQRWTLESADDGALILRSAASPEYVLMVAPDGSLIAGDPGGASEWRVVPLTG